MFIIVYYVLDIVNITVNYNVYLVYYLFNDLHLYIRTCANSGTCYVLL